MATKGARSSGAGDREDFATKQPLPEDDPMLTSQKPPPEGARGEMTPADKVKPWLYVGGSLIAFALAILVVASI